MNKGLLIGLGIAAVAGAGIYLIVRKSKTAAATIPTATNPASKNNQTAAIITGASSLAGDLFNWLTAPGNNTGSSNSTITTPANTDAAQQSSYTSSLDALVNAFA